MKFTLKIELGNDAMKYGSDLALALSDLAAKLERLPSLLGERGKIADLNGNTVGEWKIN